LSKILLIYSDETLSDYFSTVIKAFIDNDLLQVNSTAEALKLLTVKDHEIGLVLVDFNLQNSKDIINSIIKRDKALPCIITANEEDIQTAKNTFKSQTLLDYFHYYDDTEMLWNKVKKMVDLGTRGKAEKKYCRVNLNFFYSTKEVFCDVYLCLNNDKYVKVFNRYDNVDFMDLKKYDKRNIKHLYVRERDFSLITKKLVESLRPLNSQEHGLELVQNDSLNMVFSIQLQETVSEIVQKIGLNSEAVEMTTIAVNSTMSLVQKNREIYDILKKSIKGENYASEHSFLLSYLACAILKESEYLSDENTMTLTVAAFFHDVTIENSETAKIQTAHEYKFKTLGYKEQEEYLDHPMKARKLIEEIEGIPQEVFSIIEHHHERYDGSGFPQGLDYKRLSPLSSIFNLAHELALYLFESGGSPANIHSILRDMEKEYTSGNYNMALEAAKKVFHKSSPQVENSSTKKVS